MKLRQLFEEKQAGNEVAIIFGRFNPPHKGHRAAWELASKSPIWYVGTNQSTVGPKDPLPFDVKVKAMTAIWPKVAGHIVAETSWLTLASKVYQENPDATLLCLTDEDWVTKTIVQYNGKEGAHGYYNFKNIQQVPTPRLSSATALRDAVTKGDREAFAHAAGVPADIKVAGAPFFDLVAKYLLPYANAPKKVAAPKKAPAKKKEPAVAEGSEQIYKVLAVEKSNALSKKTMLKVKASSIEEVFERLAANDWYPLEINGVEVIKGKRLKQEVAEIVLNPARPIGPATAGKPAPTVANPYPSAPAAVPKVTTIKGKEYLRKELPSDMSKVQQGVDDSGNKVYMWIEKSGMRPQYTYYWFAPVDAAKETIEKHGSQYRLVSKHGHKNLGTYPTKAGAEKRERQVQYFKHAGEGVEEGKRGLMGDNGRIEEGDRVDTPLGRGTVDAILSLSQKVGVRLDSGEDKDFYPEDVYVISHQGVAEDWQKVNKHDKTDGMSSKAVSAYRRENPGSKLKTAVTKKPSELKAGSKDANRRKSFCARMGGVKGPMKDEHGKPTAKAKALSRWNCNESVEYNEAEGDPKGLPHLTKELLTHIVQQVGTEGAHAIVKSLQWGDGAAKELLHLIVKDIKNNISMAESVKQRLDPSCWKGKHKEGTKIKGGVRVNNCVPNEDVMAHTAKRLTDPKDGATAKLRAAGDKRREQQLKGRDMAKRDTDSKDDWGNFTKKLQELSNDLLGNYKKAASADASKADKEGDFKRGDKRFSGIVKATNKQFDNDMKKHKK